MHKPSVDYNMAALILRRGSLSGNRTAMTFEEKDLSYAELEANVRQLAGGLRELGVCAGDRVGQRDRYKSGCRPSGRCHAAPKRIFQGYARHCALRSGYGQLRANLGRGHRINLGKVVARRGIEPLFPG